MVDDAHFMTIALALAERGRATTSPNPMVGAIVVDAEGVIVGRGAHQRAGGPHAEVIALEDAGPRARGATLYCTLEPCSHTGRTGPCAPLVGAAGIRRAVVALSDPNPLVEGRGLAHLRDRGIEVVIGVEAAAAEEQNAVFLTVQRRARPYVIVKAALGVDGKVAAAAGVPIRITGAASDRRIHRQRAEVDAVGIGSGTVLADDPLLTARGAYRERPLTRVVFDRRLRTPPGARLFSTLDRGRVIIVGGTAGGPAAETLRRAGAEVIPFAADQGLDAALAALLARGVQSIVLEGGPRLHQSALAAGVVDRVDLYLSPRRLGDGGLSWLPPARLAWDDLASRRVEWLGSDLLVTGYVHGNH